MQTHFECDDTGELKEHVGCKINCKPHRGYLRVAQPVLLQSFEDEFNLPKGGAPTLPASPGESLTKGEPSEQLPPFLQWSHPEIKNRVREPSRSLHVCSNNASFELNV